MSERAHPWLIVGGGLAAAEAAKTLRTEGYDGELVVVTEEAHQPYERPALSKEYLRGEKPAAKLLAGDVNIWNETSTDLLTGRRAVRLDLQDRRIELDNGGRLPFDRLLLATGARPIRPKMANANADFVHVLRTIDDTDRLRAAAAHASSAVVAGGGWIAAEVAASLRQLGLQVQLVVPGRDVLDRKLGGVVSQRYSELHRRHGVRIVRGARVIGILDAASGPGVHLDDGQRITGDLLVLGFGATPNTDLAREAGLPLDSGIEADAFLETPVPGIFVAGDVASAWHPGYGRRLRVEHWDNAKHQGRIAARNMLGQRVAYERTPYFYSDQFELGMETFGIPPDDGTVLIREAGDGGFIALWLVSGRAVAGLQANAWDASKDVKSLVEEEAPINLARFNDASVPLPEVRRQPELRREVTPA